MQIYIYDSSGTLTEDRNDKNCTPLPARPLWSAHETKRQSMRHDINSNGDKDFCLFG
jgi:hypothetical protein